MDLDVVVADNINKIFTHKPGQWLICRDFTRAMRLIGKNLIAVL